VPSLYTSTWPSIYMQTLLVSRDVVRAVGAFDERFRTSMDTDFAFRLGLITPMCYVNLPLVEVDRTPDRAVGLMTEFPLNGAERLHVHEQMIVKWLRITKRARPDLKPQLTERLSHTQSALANRYLLNGDLKTTRAILWRALAYNPRPAMIAKYFWSWLSPGSLRAEVVRRESGT
jgi:hypothetical protein